MYVSTRSNPDPVLFVRIPLGLDRIRIRNNATNKVSKKLKRKNVHKLHLVG